MTDQIVEPVKSFIVSLRQAVYGRRPNNTQALYTSWQKMTEQYFKLSEWPHASQIRDLVEDDNLFLGLYNELAFRNVYTISKGITMEQRLQAWLNITNLFDRILDAEKPLQLYLPPQWVWDLLDEFVYQYQEFTRQKQGELSSNDANILESNANLWNPVLVFKYLHRFVIVSDIKKTLENERKGLYKVSQRNAFAASLVYQNFGYFSLIQLCRLNCVLGDYHLALKSIDPIDIHNKKARHRKVPSAHSSLHYYLGFCYLMHRRYYDAISIFSSFLLFGNRPRPSYQVNKMFSLLAILVKLYPKKLDDNIVSTLKQEHSEKLAIMQRGDSDILFVSACPKYVTAATGTDELPPELTTQLDLQRKIFSQEMTQQQPLSTLWSYLQLYSTIDLVKLRDLVDPNVDTEILREYLFRFVHKFRQLHWVAGIRPSDGVWTDTSDIKFWLEQDTIHSQENIVKQNFSAIYLSNSAKLDEIVSDFERD